MEKIYKNGKNGQLGKKRSIETREKMSKVAKEKGFGKWAKGKHHSEETKEKIGSKSKGNTHWLGKNHREETKLKMSLSAKGRIFTDEHKRKLSEAQKKRTGSKNANWKGGLSFQPYTVDWTETLKRSIRERDNYICKVCNQYGKDIHHIDYDKKNCDPRNLATLCKICHCKTNSKREYWQEYFNK